MVQFEEFEINFYKNDEQTIHECLINNTKEQNKLSFNIFEYDTTIDLIEKYFKRENDEYIFLLDIKNKTCTVTLKKENIKFDIQVELCELTQNLDKITLEYLIETDDSRNKIIIKKKGT
jgi:hypothetical protein